MRQLSLLVLLVVLSCKSPSETEKIHQVVSGKWLILYPDHQLENSRQRTIYGKIQDSIVGLTGLKLVTLSDDGRFSQADSLGVTGRWGVTGDNVVFIENGGKGFDNFSGRFTGYEKNLLRLTEYVNAGGERIKLVWHLKKVSGKAANLFTASRNQWRKKPAQPESATQIRKRLSEMLRYYSDYYELVTAESSYFIPTRVILPFRFYQHAMGMQPIEVSNAFENLFYDRQQADEAYHILSATMERLEDDFPSRDNYIKEYAAFMKSMSYDLAR